MTTFALTVAINTALFNVLYIECAVTRPLGPTALFSSLGPVPLMFCLVYIHARGRTPPISTAYDMLV